MKNIKNGEKYGCYTIIENLGTRKKDGHVYYKVKCDCGNEQILRSSIIRNGIQICCPICSKKKSNTYKHGMSNTRIFNIWQDMFQRCYNSNCKAYKNYGARGIIICDEWKNNFISFYNWSIKNGYDDTLTIDRIDVNGNYEPLNCRWADKYMQANNTRTNRHIKYNGEIHTMAEWSKILNIESYNLENRLNKYGWSIEKAFSTPVRKIKKKE